MNNYLTEAFKALNVLEEDTFNITDDEDIEKLKKFIDDDMDVEDSDFAEIIDTEARNEDELQDSYVGKVILKCQVCPDCLIYKDPAEVILNDAGDLANEGEECPICGSMEGFKVVGQIKEFGKDDVESGGDDEKTEIEASEEVVEEGKKEDDGYGGLYDALFNHGERGSRPYSEFQFWSGRSGDDDYNFGVRARTEEELDKAIELFKKFGHDDYKIDKVGKLFIAKTKINEALKEDFQRVSIETDKETMTMESHEDGGVSVTTSPKNEEVEEIRDTEVVAPVDVDTEAEIESNSIEDEDEFEIDEFSEEDFDELGESYLKKVYENVSSYKTTKGKLDGKKIQLEGIITFNSGKQAKTSFVFESHAKTKRGKLKFLGENASISPNRKAFVITGNINDKKLCVESFTYNYSAKGNDGKSKRLYGTISKKSK